MECLRLFIHVFRNGFELDRYGVLLRRGVLVWYIILQHPRNPITTFSAFAVGKETINVSKEQSFWGISPNLLLVGPFTILKKVMCDQVPSEIFFRNSPDLEKGRRGLGK